MFGIEKKESDNKIDQLRYLSQSALIEEKSDLYFIKKVVLVVSVAVFFAILWAAFTKVDEIAISHGNVIPTKDIQLVQHLEGGIVSKIKVQEGDLVKKGDVLVTLSGASFSNDLESLNSKRVALEYEAIRLRALINNTEPKFEQIDDSEQDIALAKEQMKIYHGTIKAREDEREIIRDQIKQKEALIEGILQKQKTDKENMKLINEEKNIKENLYKKGHVSKFQYIQVQKQLNSILGEIEENESAISQARSAVDEYKNRLDFLDSRFIDETYNELNDIESDLAQVNEAIDKFEDKVNRLQITAPIDGYIKILNVNTLGGVIDSGKIIAEIIPLEGGVVIEVQINPKDIGYIKVGQDADIKISTYDYSRYGSLKGKLTYISASAFENEEGQRYYIGTVTMGKNYVGNDPSRNIIIPGMIAQVDIITGNKSILSYLLKPIHKSVTSSFFER
ncbi:MAG TPA: HlyD family type I secretion periplasmic adaptor subunit [Candidatus Megaira endosymbiont of Nemacystus decipiens]|nr:HlyD family type I secretion periplasmic adaptor subunit [Candidatus Megaera endosymbiont of Nemacystus decipiens]